MRTPRAAAARGEDRLVAEAQNLARLQQGQTPLFGGDSGVHIEKGDFGDSLDPRAGQSVRATPSALAGMTPLGGQTGMRSIAGVPGTPSVAGTPLRTTGTWSCPEATLLPRDISRALRHACLVLTGVRTVLMASEDILHLLSIPRNVGQVLGYGAAL